jgi:dihydrofolate synthase/folylpolyglutamate synthase
MNYSETVRFLYSLGNEVKAAKLGLESVRALLAAVGDPHLAGEFVHVAGTNGKGSAAAMIEAGLRAAGVRTGLYTSPHLVEPTERIRIAGEPVSRDAFAAAFERVHAAAERLMAAGTLAAHPTYFETVTAMAFLLFREARVQTAVIEVGLGGRLDATNVITPRVAVIMPVDFDHESFLGRSLEGIAAEKAGILKPGARAVMAPQRPEVEQTLAEAAEALGIEPVWTARWTVRDLELRPDGSRFRVEANRTFEVECPLAGEHQVANAVAAVAVLDALGLGPEAIRQGIAQTRWPGRLERIRQHPDIVLDGAHNPAGARVLAAYIRRFYSGRRVWLIYGAMRDKAVEEIAAILFPLAAEIVATAPALARAVRPETIAALADHPRLRTAPTFDEALALVLGEAAPDDAVFVSGSLFLVGEARHKLE